MFLRYAIALSRFQPCLQRFCHLEHRCSVILPYGLNMLKHTLTPLGRNTHPLLCYRPLQKSDIIDEINHLDYLDKSLYVIESIDSYWLEQQAKKIKQRSK